MYCSRRHFLRTSAAAAAGFTGLGTFARWAYGVEPPDDLLGPLMPDRLGVLDLPSGFSYKVISTAGTRMDDGLLVPPAPDGMATFPGPDGRTILLRNHELIAESGDGHFDGEQRKLLAELPERLTYDAKLDDGHCLGGVSTLVYDTRSGLLEREFLSLAGTVRNCAGGPTPWGSWITCEETTQRAEDGFSRHHGYNFEVAASDKRQLQEPVALPAMGRFNHEAVAVDPRSGIVYQTEDRGDGLIYRFIPARPGRLPEGGKLQALGLWDRPGLDTRNWLGAGDDPEDAAARPDPEVVAGTELDVRWIDVEEIDNPEDDLRLRGFDLGAARFARGEGMWYGEGSVFFACTSGGRWRQGQVWRYTPSPYEGTGRETSRPGRLELYAEPSRKGLIENADNLVVAPWGDVLLCEDGGEDDFLIGIRPNGTFYPLARNAVSKSELAGATFSPDGSTLFMNIQGDGLTLAITGPWPTRS